MAVGDKVIKVTKKGKLYAVVKETEKGLYYDYEYWYVIDITSGTIIKKCYSASDAKWYLDALEGGYDTPETHHTSWNSEWGKPIDMPASLKKQQQQLLNPTPKKQTASKPIGSTSASISKVIDMGAYKLLEMDDGTFGVLIPSTGESKLGLKSAAGAKTSAKSMLKKMAGQRLGAMGVDAGSDAVDTLLKVYEDRMRDMYGQAAREMAQKQAKALAEFERERKEAREKLANGTITQEQYDAWVKSQTVQQGWYQDMVDSLGEDLVAADRKAMDMLNGYIPRAYAENMNFATFQIEGDANISTGFALYNESTVARLIANPEGSLLPELPQAKIDELKDAVWGKQKISSSVTQSILQGESIPQAAARLQKVVGMSANSAMRAARTSMTAAQNLGRLDAGRRAKGMGIDLKKQWIATVDSRTRYSHREIDRETVELEEDFSNGCDCPAHLNSGKDPSEVYNCRCAMRYVVAGHEYDDLPDKTKEGVAYDDWKNERMTKLASQKDKIQAQLDDANAHISELKKLLPEDKDFGQIVQGGAKASQWTPEKVASSEEFYFQKLQKAIANNNQYDIDWYKNRLAQLKEYDDAGRAYHEVYSAIGPQLQRWQNVVDQAKGKLAKMTKASDPSTGAYSEQRRSAASWFASSEDADKALRRWTGDAWKAAERKEKSAINRYTGGSYEEYNRPLNGYDGSWYSAENFVGVGNADIDQGGFGGYIRDMTRYLSKSITQQDMWLRRGEGRTALAPFFGLPAGTDITSLSEETLRGFIGTSARIGSFQSCGTTASTGFTHKPVVIEYFVPAGSQAAYVEPFSQCGRGDGLSWDGDSSQWRLGGELETILQRGGSYVMVDFKYTGGKPTFVMEVHPEDGYWTFQQDD